MVITWQNLQKKKKKKLKGDKMNKKKIKIWDKEAQQTLFKEIKTTTCDFCGKEFSLKKENDFFVHSDKEDSKIYCEKCRFKYFDL